MKYAVFLQSKTGFKKPFSSIVMVDAEDHGHAVKNAIKKVCTDNKLYQFRNDEKFWRVLFCKEKKND